jgi:hypothetical protein
MSYHNKGSSSFKLEEKSKTMKEETDMMCKDKREDENVHKN